MTLVARGRLMRADCGHDTDRPYPFDADGVSRCATCSRERTDRMHAESAARVREQNERWANRDESSDPTMIDNVNRRRI